MSGLGDRRPVDSEAPARSQPVMPDRQFPNSRIGRRTEAGVAERVLVLVGTKKGAFILESDAARRAWALRGPFCETWPMNHVVADPATGAIYGGGGNEWYGPAVWTSADLGATWTHSSRGLGYPAGEAPVRSVW